MLANRYDPGNSEFCLREFWEKHEIYAFNLDAEGEVYSIDTPPPTVSGYLHLGHVYSYSHTDFMARFWRMQGKRVFYPMGFDDNGLPTERFVQKKLKLEIANMGRQEFIRRCLEISIDVEQTYRKLWEYLGLSVDWKYTYRTIDEESRRIAQWSFLDLYAKGLVYRQEAPAIWCSECQASFAQADLNDLERTSEFVTLEFQADQDFSIPVATTRPELLAACVAVFVNPSDNRYTHFLGQNVKVPFYDQFVPVLADPGADPEKGTGAVMCCTFGDTVDIQWWRTHHLPTIELISPEGTLTEQAGPLVGLSVETARTKIKELLAGNGLIRARESTLQSIRIHERCDTPVEYLMAPQWFIRLLDHKLEFIKLGEQLNWYPSHMKGRYLDWVENLSWDWCISRQRMYGVPFPVWYCKTCKEVVTASVTNLPVDPLNHKPDKKCPHCGGVEFEPETDVFDTWMTSSNSPQIVGKWQNDPGLYDNVFPFSLRPHAHEIIRTWTFYSIVKTYFHFKKLPWKDIAISGWAIAGEGMEKISKSRGGGSVGPHEMIETYSGDAVRYWAASTSPGKDAVISEDKIRSGSRLINKLWNVARFSERFLNQIPNDLQEVDTKLSPADRWILARMQVVIQQTTSAMNEYDYAFAKNEVEGFFWHDLADNYLEMAKQRLYDSEDPMRSGALFTLQYVFCTTLKLFAPFFPFITDKIYQELFSTPEGMLSIHLSNWPKIETEYKNSKDEAFGDILIAIAGAVRRYKSQHNLPLGEEIKRLQLAADDPKLQLRLRESDCDLRSITRAKQIHVTGDSQDSWELIENIGKIKIGIL